MASLTEISKYTLHKERITSIVTPKLSESNTLICCSRDKSVSIWSKTSEGLIIENVFENFGSFVNDAKNDKTNSKMVVATQNSQAFIVDVSTKKRTLLNGHTGSVKCCDIDSGNTHIATGSIDGTIKIWNVEGECIYDLPSLGTWVVSLRFMFNRSDQIIAGYSDGRVRIIDINNNNCVVTFFKGAVESESPLITSKPVGSQVSSITTTGEGPYCAYSTWEGIFYILNLENHRNVSEMNVNSPVNSVAFCAIKPYLAISTKNEIIIYDVSSSKKIVEKPFPKSNECFSVCWLGTSIVCGFKNGEICTFDLEKD